MTRTARLLAGCTLIAAVGLFPTMQANAAPSNGGVLATFEGRTINLAQSWGAATACTSDGVTTQCFRSVAEMDQVLDSVASSASRYEPHNDAMCTAVVAAGDGAESLLAGRVPLRSKASRIIPDLN